jgi:4-amino-4-deoxy-L-arabinose transferase-like glycosyltransferase
MQTELLRRLRTPLGSAAAAIFLAWCVGMFGRGYWTPDEPREADISWRMSWQTDKAVPSLAGDAFCEKPPLTYWIAAASISVFGTQAWAARLPNLLYAIITALAVGSLARRSVGPLAAVVAAAAIGTFLLSYQVLIWLATDAPLLAADSVALLGVYIGFYAADRRQRVRGYLLMHAALAAGFLCKSAAAWMVPVLALLTLAIWEKRWRELLRWELYVGLPLQAAVILPWVWFVYTGPDGPAHLKVFFWNNLVGRFAHIDAAPGLQYATGHRNFPGKYLLELPLYLWPWTLLVIAAARRAWRQRKASLDATRPVRFALASALPPLAVLSVAATARNIYLAPALPGAALLLGWWAQQVSKVHDTWDLRALRLSAALLLLAACFGAAALTSLAVDTWPSLSGPAAYIVISALGLIGAGALAKRAELAARHAQVLPGLAALLLAYCALLVGPASQAYRQVDLWQNLASIGQAVQRDSGGRPLILFAPDETTRAMIDMHARSSITVVQGPIDDAAIEMLKASLSRAPQSLVVTQLRGRNAASAWLSIAQNQTAVELPWLPESGLRLLNRYALPNGRRYALLELKP